MASTYAYGTFKSTNIRYTNTSGKSASSTIYVAPYIRYTVHTTDGKYIYNISQLGFALRANSSGTASFYGKFPNARSSQNVASTCIIKTSNGNSANIGGSQSVPCASLNYSNDTVYYLESSSLIETAVSRTKSAQTFSVYVDTHATFNSTSLGTPTIYSATVPAKPSYTITLSGNGGTSTSATKWYDETLTLTQTSSRTGYTFNGWYTATSGGSKVTSVTANSAATYYAQWTENTATLTYNANGHGTAPQPVTMRYTTATTAAALPTESGWQCVGWNTEADGSGTMYQPNDVIKAANVVPSAKILYAIWEKAGPEVFTKIDGVWVKGPLRVKADGQWFECTEGFIKVGGEWKPIE